MWITNGGFADVYVVFAKVDGEKFSCFIVERGTPGFSAGAEEKKMGIRGSSTVPLFFENAPIPKENLLHEIGRGHIVAFNTLNVGRFSLGAYCLGGSKDVLEASSKYSKERTAFGKRLCDFGLIQAKLGEMAMRIYAVESMIYRSAGMIESAVSSPGDTTDKTKQAMQVLEEYAIESSISKVAGSETLDFCVDESVQVFGGYGFHEDYPVARAEEERSLTQAKKIFLLAAGAAVQKFREQLADQQEIVASLANIVMDVYAVESSLRRAQKSSAARGQAASAMLDAVRAFTYDAMDRIEKEARTALAAVAGGDTLVTQLAVLRRFAKHAPLDTIAIRRRLAEAVLAQDRYPFEGR
jgi:hypothetical protein